MTDHPCRIFQYMHCRLCMNELPAGTPPKYWARLEVGWTQEGIQVWCTRHNTNVLDLDFLGNKVSPYAEKRD